MTIQDLAKLQYTRALWKHPRMRRRLIAHWTDPRHPYRLRWKKYRDRVIEVLRAPPDHDRRLDGRLRRNGNSLREVAREIPPVFGSFW